MFVVYCARITLRDYRKSKYIHLYLALSHELPPFLSAMMVKSKRSNRQTFFLRIVFVLFVAAFVSVLHDAVLDVMQNRPILLHFPLAWEEQKT